MPNLLVIDDEEYISKLIHKIASKKKYNIDVAKNFFEANEMIQNNTIYDFVFIDYSIDKARLNEIISLIKTKNIGCKIVLMSGMTEEEINQGIMYDKFIFKPEIVDIINKIL